MTLRLADHDWLTASTDAPANTRFEGLIDPSGRVELLEFSVT